MGAVEGIAKKERKIKGNELQRAFITCLKVPFDCMHASVGAAMHPHSFRLSDHDLTALIEQV